MKTIPGFAVPRGSVPCVIAACLLAISLMTPASSAAQQAEAVKEKVRKRSLSWNPPNIDSPVRSASPSPPCVLASVLEYAGMRANELKTDLQNFTAQEEIAYESFSREGVRDAGSATFNYVVIFELGPGQPTVTESRSHTRGDSLGPVSEQDRGLPEIVLMFLPTMQDDYEMKCEGTAEWEGQRTWVVQFRQRPDKRSRTFSLGAENEVYAARLKGHAWIAADSGEVVHLETGLMEAIPSVKMAHWFLAVNYGPVQFQTQNVRVWLPQSADSYYDFADHRTAIYHTFTNFMLFSVQTDQKIGKPKQP